MEKIFDTADLYRHMIDLYALAARRKRPFGGGPGTVTEILLQLKYIRFADHLEYISKMPQSIFSLLDIHDHILKAQSIFMDKGKVDRDMDWVLPVKHRAEMIVLLSHIFAKQAKLRPDIDRALLQRTPEMEGQVRLFVENCRNIEKLARVLNDTVLRMPPDMFRSFCSRMIQPEAKPLLDGGNTSLERLDVRAQQACKRRFLAGNKGPRR